MRRPRAEVLLATLLATVLAGACAQSNPELPRGRISVPATPGPDDVRAFPGPPPGFADERPGIAHGRVEAFGYDSPVTGTRRKATVYLPPGYSSERRYPVLYLLHGLAGTEDEWRGYVHATAILDNLNAGGAVVPAIVVMPNGRALANDRPPPEERKFSPEHVAGFARFERELLDTLIPAIDKRYATVPDARHRALAGLSMGGGQSLNFGLSHQDTFGWVGAFSAAPNTEAAARLLPGRPSLALLYLSCGKQDDLFGVSQGFHRYLKQQGIGHMWNVDEFGHDRESWMENLYHFSQLLFRPR